MTKTDSSREARLAAALRENLRKRKAAHKSAAAGDALAMLSAPDRVEPDSNG
ncbi:MAG: hypothetical protein KGQ42_03245 [Alphaproteobacteria bacterium]|nr:hypothetical protein [Alphaproteobacteria bacterium]MDE2041646.1 hypothetical protein [Alphaproteobacteria bacterium]MDE2340571.1 hypothetical protein [Alphaproteobacteria bacterium]